MYTFWQPAYLLYTFLESVHNFLAPFAHFPFGYGVLGTARGGPTCLVKCALCLLSGSGPAAGASACGGRMHDVRRRAMQVHPRPASGVDFGTQK